MLYVGIDFGVINSSIAVIDEYGQALVRKLINGYGEKNEIIRTQLHFNLNGEVDCEDLRVYQEPERSIISLARKIIDSDGAYQKEVDEVLYSSEQLVALFFQQLFYQAEIEVDDISRLVINIPAGASQQYKRILEQATSLLGLKEVLFLDEILSIFMFYKNSVFDCFSRIPYSKILMLQFGPDTCNIAVTYTSDIESLVKEVQIDHWYQMQSCHKDCFHLGSDKFDSVIVKFFIEKGIEQGNIICEKIDLANFDDMARLKKLREQPVYKKLKRLAEMVRMRIEEIGEVQLSIPPLHPKFDLKGIRGLSLTREQYDRLCEPLWIEFINRLEEIQERDRIEVVLLVKDGIYSNLVEEILEQRFPNARIISSGYFDCDTIISQGNAIFSLLAQNIDGFDYDIDELSKI